MGPIIHLGAPPSTYSAPKAPLVKFQFSWPQVAVLAILLSAVIIANLVAPGVVGAVISLVSTISGALFVNLKEPPGPPDPPAFPVAPVQGSN